jgi:hypothetical protein
MWAAVASPSARYKSMVSEMFNINEQDTRTFILLSLPRYALDFILRQTTLVACDGDMT